MLRAHARVDHTQWPGQSPPSLDHVAETIRALSGSGSVVVVIEATKSGRIRFLRRLVPALHRNGSRVVQAASFAENPLDFHSLVNQVVGVDDADGTDRTEQFYNALARPESGVSRVTLVIDDAHLLTDETVHCLDLMVSFASLTSLQLQLLLVGTPRLWGRLPATGRLAADNAAARIWLAGQDVEAEPEPDVEPPKARLAPRDVPAMPAWPGLNLLGYPISGDYSDLADPMAVPPAKEVVPALRSAKAGRGRWLVRASIGAVVLVGGLAVTGLSERPRDLGGLWVATTQYVGLWLDRNIATPVSEVVQAGRLAKTSRNSASREAAQPIAPPATAAPATEIVPAATPEPVIEPTPPVEQAMADPTDAVPPAEQAAPAASQPPVEASPTAAIVAAEPPKPAAPASPVATPASPPLIAPNLVAILLARGDALLETGDIVAARLMYERIAATNSAAGAISLGMTYDPRFLAQIGAQGLAPDPQRAVFWYQRATELGSVIAPRLLQQMRAFSAK